jgi:hypothetical protein
MKPSRHHIAAGATVLALGALATVALASGGTGDATAPRQSAPEVRTEIIHRSGRSSASPSPTRAAPPAPTSVAPASSPDHHRGRGRDDAGFDDHGRGRDDAGFDDHGGGRGRGREDDAGFDDRRGDRDEFEVEDRGDDDGGGHGPGRGRGRDGDD